ncbi:MAG TPA: SGNH/GDSL hydrolase family protein [Stenomitos sp.]
MKLNLKPSIGRFRLPVFVAGTLLSVLCIGIAPSKAEPSDKPIRIMPLGDSITQGNTKHNSYRRPLWLELRKAGYNVDFVGSTRENFKGLSPSSDFDPDHEGHWGWRVDEALERIDGWMRISEPDIVLIHLGNNDLTRGQSLESTIEELRQLIQRIRAVNPRVKLLIAQIIPCGNPARIQQLNKLIGNLARRTNTQESPIVVVDQFRGFNPKAGVDTYDGCHPSEVGEQKMASRWLAALKKVLPNP